MARLVVSKSTHHTPGDVADADDVEGGENDEVGGDLNGNDDE